MGREGLQCSNEGRSRLQTPQCIAHVFNWCHAGVIELTRPFGSGHEGPRGRTYATKRTQSVEAFWHLVLQCGYIILRAPLESGKTSLLQLLGAYAHSIGVPVVHINCSQLGGRTIDDAFDEKSWRFVMGARG